MYQLRILSKLCSAPRRWSLQVSMMLVVCLVLSGCITEMSGGLPGPASKERRVKAQLDLARGYLEQRNFARARPVLERALEIDAKSVEGHVLSAVVFHSMAEYALAEQHYVKALKFDPRNAQALNNYGSFLYARGRYEEALKPLIKLVDDTSYHARPQAFENLGLAYLKVDKIPEAKKAFDRSAELNSSQLRSNLELAQIAFDVDQFAQAKRYYERYNKFSRRPSARGLCLGVKLSTATEEADDLASYSLALNNLFPEQAARCQTQK